MRVVVALCALQLACGNPPTTPTPVPPATPPPPASVVLRVQIVESTTGARVAGAFLSVRRSGETLQFQERADDEGVIQFNDFKPGVITLTAARTGYEASQQEVTVASDTTVELRIVPRRFLLSAASSILMGGSRSPARLSRCWTATMPHGRR